jgi:hypothetical protein
MFRSHRDSAGNTHTVALGILAGLLSTSVTAADAPDSFVLVAYSDRAGGSHLSEGDYRGATQLLRKVPSGVLLDPAAVASNRCVAYAMTQQLAAARSACDSAVEELQPASGSVLTQPHDTAAALAYSNRAVVRWLSAQHAAARVDLARARQLDPQAQFVQRNLAATQGHTDVPVLAAAPSPALAAPQRPTE